jgi:hypothetical protein
MLTFRISQQGMLVYSVKYAHFDYIKMAKLGQRTFRRYCPTLLSAQESYYRVKIVDCLAANFLYNPNPDNFASNALSRQDNPFETRSL